MSCQSSFDARYWMLGAGALGRPRGMVWGEKTEEGSGWGTHAYLWQIHFDIWQNQYNIVKLNKIKLKKEKKIKNTQIFNIFLFTDIFLCNTLLVFIFSQPHKMFTPCRKRHILKVS